MHTQSFPIKSDMSKWVLTMQPYSVRICVKRLRRFSLFMLSSILTLQLFAVCWNPPTYLHATWTKRRGTFGTNPDRVGSTHLFFFLKVYVNMQIYFRSMLKKDCPQNGLFFLNLESRFNMQIYCPNHDGWLRFLLSFLSPIPDQSPDAFILSFRRPDPHC